MQQIDIIRQRHQQELLLFLRQRVLLKDRPIIAHFIKRKCRWLIFLGLEFIWRWADERMDKWHELHGR